MTKAEKEMALWATALIVAPTLEEYLKRCIKDVGNKAIRELEMRK